MSHLFAAVDKPFEQMGFVAIAINKHGSHIGLLFRLSLSDRIRILHLGWDHDLRDEEIADWTRQHYHWVALSIVEDRAKQVAQFCDLVAYANPDGIPYAFGDPMGSYNSDGKFIEANQRVGLTCASFVLSVLEQSGINLLDRRNWQKHFDDQNFFRYIIKALRGEIPGFRAAKRPDHHIAVSNQVAAGAVRYKPTEVAGAAICSFMPISFFEACMRSGEIKNELPHGNNDPPWWSPF